jgi:general secretion pathway protein G
VIRRLQWRRRGPAGFTMIEVLVVITLIVLLASLAMVQYTNSVKRTREAVLKEDLFRLRESIDQFYADKGKWPQSLEELVSEHYLREVPQDPMTSSRTTWQTVPAEPDPGNPTAEPGIYDVKSGAEGVALGGTNYADW